MAKWSIHPMDSDDAVAACREFMADYAVVKDNMSSAYYVRPKEEIASIIKGFTLSDLRTKSESGECIKKNKYVIPFLYLQYGIVPFGSEFKRFLLDSLDSHAAFDAPGSSMEYELLYLDNFKNHFEDIISGRMDPTPDESLYEALDAELAAKGRSGR